MNVLKNVKPLLIALQIDGDMDNTPKEIIDEICSDIIKEVVEGIEIGTNNRTDGEEDDHTGN